MLPLATSPRAQLMRAFIDYKADLDTDTVRASDQMIFDHVDDITAILLRDLMTALIEDDANWFSRHAWFVDLLTVMLEDAAGEPYGTC